MSDVLPFFSVVPSGRALGRARDAIAAKRTVLIDRVGAEETNIARHRFAIFRLGTATSSIRCETRHVGIREHFDEMHV
ncbi:Hypothetical protein NGAL_HAMBI2610_20210 [Neorhizobium galegae bv. orientalis]|nr:Hypothetical protein NGAL_HAMBI2610_20210 [Neorhizobium galegae bv. orientalis]